MVRIYCGVLLLSGIFALGLHAQETPSVSKGIIILPCSSNEMRIPVRPALYSSALNGGSIIETSKKQQNVNKAFADTSRKSSYVRKYAVTTNNENVNIWLELAEDQDAMQVTCWNILGKKVKDFGKVAARAGTAEDTDGDGNIQLYIGDIPNGIYIISIEGDGFRAAFRITISR